jgi:hypothetical protein
MYNHQSVVKDHHHGNSFGGEEPETWAEGGEEDQWNSTSWQDLDDNDTSTTSQDVKHSRKTQSPRHLRNVSASSSDLPHSDNVEAGGNGGSAKDRRNSQDSQITQKPTKPKVANLDIMSLDIKTSTKKETGGEFDFFADMQPDIKVDSKGLWGVLNDNKVADKNVGETKKTSETTAKEATTMSFAIKEAAEVEVDIILGADPDGVYLSLTPG